MSRIALAAVLTVLFALPASAQETYKIDGGHTSVLFKIKHLNVAYFYGRFRSVTGSITWGGDDPSKAKIAVEIKADSVYSGNARRDKHIVSADFLDAAQYPTLSFTSSSIAATKEKNVYKVSGKLSCHGVTKDVSFDFRFTGEGKDPWGNYRVGGHAELTIKRSDFGMTKMMDKLGDEVTLIIAIEGMRKLKDGE